MNDHRETPRACLICYSTTQGYYKLLLVWLNWSWGLRKLIGESSHHKGLVHVVLTARAAIVVLGVDGEAEEEYVYYALIDGEETVGHQEGEHTHDDERQHPDGVLALIVQRKDARKRRAWHDQHLQTQETQREKLKPPIKTVLLLIA